MSLINVVWEEGAFGGLLNYKNKIKQGIQFLEMECQKVFSEPPCWLIKILILIAILINLRVQTIKHKTNYLLLS